MFRIKNCIYNRKKYFVNFSFDREIQNKNANFNKL